MKIVYIIRDILIAMVVLAVLVFLVPAFIMTAATIILVALTIHMVMGGCRAIRRMFNKSMEEMEFIDMAAA